MPESPFVPVLFILILTNGRVAATFWLALSLSIDANSIVEADAGLGTVPAGDGVFEVMYVMLFRKSNVRSFRTCPG
jgi:hypothetical protein